MLRPRRWLTEWLTLRRFTVRTGSYGNAENARLAGAFWSVELRGFEPLTPCMPCKCSARLSYSPKSVRFGIVSGFRCGGFDLCRRSVGPETLQLVVVAGLTIEDVHDDVAVVQQDPLAEVLALASQDATFHTGLELMLDLFDQRLHVTRRGPGGDDEDIGDDHEFGDVEEEDVFALLVGNRRRCSFGCSGGFCMGGDS